MPQSSLLKSLTHDLLKTWHLAALIERSPNPRLSLLASQGTTHSHDRVNTQQKSKWQIISFLFWHLQISATNKLTLSFTRKLKINNMWYQTVKVLFYSHIYSNVKLDYIFYFLYKTHKQNDNFHNDQYLS